MVCPEFSYSENIVSFTARYTLNGFFTGTVIIADPNCAGFVDCNVCQPIRLNIDSTTTGVCEDCETFAEDACFSDNPYWVAGIATSVQRAGYYNDVPTMIANVVAYSDYLSTKPIGTEQFLIADLKTSLSTVLTTYLGVPSALFDISELSIADAYIQGPVEGNSAISELQQLAAAGYCHLFTQVGGVLTFGKWRDISEPTDYIIPPELIVNVEKSPLAPSRVSVIRARGAGVPKYNCGKQVFTDNRVSDGPGGISSVPGNITNCSFSGVPTPSINILFDNLAASEDDIQNAEVVSDDVDNTGINNLKDGTFTTKISRTDGSWFSDQASEYKIQVEGFRRPDYDYVGGDFSQPATQQTSWNSASANYKAWASLSPWPIPKGSFFGSSGFGKPSGTYEADQPSIERIEVETIDPDLSACGIKYEQIDNPYIPSKENLFYQTIQRFREIHMEENTWLVEIAYMPCLRLNQIIEFQASEHEGCNEQTVRGIIAGIDIEYTVEPNVTMKLVVWGFDCLEGTSYTSGNLINYQCAGYESASSNPWITTALGLDSQATLEDNCGYIYTFGFPSTAELELVQDNMTIGDVYTVSFDYEALGAGFSPFTFDWGAGSTPLNGSGSFSIPFAAGGTTTNFTWTLSNTFVPEGYNICNIQLTKTIIA